MGSTNLEQQIGTPIDNNLIALVVTNQTEKVIKKIEEDQATADYVLNETINFKKDTLLHYACAKNNQRLVEYILGRTRKLTKIRNNDTKLPADLTNNQKIKYLCSASNFANISP